MAVVTNAWKKKRVGEKNFQGWDNEVQRPRLIVPAYLFKMWQFKMVKMDYSQ